jgi:hypothetical protein
MIDKPGRFPRIVVFGNPRNEEILVAENFFFPPGLKIETFDGPVKGYRGWREQAKHVMTLGGQGPSFG